MKKKTQKRKLWYIMLPSLLVIAVLCSIMFSSVWRNPFIPKTAEMKELAQTIKTIKRSSDIEKVEVEFSPGGSNCKYIDDAESIRKLQHIIGKIKLTGEKEEKLKYIGGWSETFRFYMADGKIYTIAIFSNVAVSSMNDYNYLIDDPEIFDGWRNKVDLKDVNK